jgi:drug/metabolite transporter (DMT)-like permease
MNFSATGWFSLIAAVIIWGISFSSTKTALLDFPPNTLAFLRFFIAGILMFLLLKLKEPQAKIKGKDFLSLFLTVLTGITLYFLCENHGIALIPASSASLIVATIPIFTLLTEKIFLKRKIGVIGILASMLSFVGIFLLIGTASGGKQDIRGYIFMLGACISWVAYLFLIRPLQEKYSSLALTAWQMLIGAATLFPFALLEYNQWRVPSSIGIFNLLYQAIFCSAGAYLFYNHAVHHLGVRPASLSVNLIPIVAPLAAFLFLGEFLGSWQLFGGVLVIISVILINVKKRD